jgi:hypothetical protein
MGDAFDDAALGQQVARTPSADPAPLIALHDGAPDAGVVLLNGFEIGEKGPDALGPARGVDFVVNRGHGSLHKWMLVV